MYCLGKDHLPFVPSHKRIGHPKLYQSFPQGFSLNLVFLCPPFLFLFFIINNIFTKLSLRLQALHTCTKADTGDLTISVPVTPPPL